jgi:hypothetical protein
MACPGALLFSICRRMHSTGFWVPWVVSVSCPPLGMLQSVVCLRSPVQLPFFAHRVSAGLVLPVIVTAPDHRPLLGPDDLGPDGKPMAPQAFRHRDGVERSMPDVCDAAGKEAPGGLPVRTLIVSDLADARGSVHAHPMAPGGIVFHAIGWVGDHQMR